MCDLSTDKKIVETFKGPLYKRYKSGNAEWIILLTRTQTIRLVKPLHGEDLTTDTKWSRITSKSIGGHYPSLDTDLVTYLHTINLEEMLMFLKLSGPKVNIQLDRGGMLMKGKCGSLQLGVVNGPPRHKREGVDLSVLLNDAICGRRLMIGLSQSGGICLSSTLTDGIIFSLILS